MMQRKAAAEAAACRQGLLYPAVVLQHLVWQMPWLQQHIAHQLQELAVSHAGEPGAA